jgi:hypothetical protein
METNFKIGDKVRIINEGIIYINYDEMANLMGLTKWMPRYGANIMTGVIVSIKKHPNSDEMLAGVDLGKKEIIIDLNGLELLNDIPEKWCIEITKENIDILLSWWKKNTIGWEGSLPEIECTLLSEHPTDKSKYYYNHVNGFLESHPEYEAITLEQFKTIILKNPIMETNKTIQISRELLNEYYDAATMSQRYFINEHFKIDGTTTVKSIIELHNIACDTWKHIIKRNHPECFPFAKTAIELAVEKAGKPNYSGCNVKIEQELILVELPSANADWSFAAFEWVLKFCKENPGCYPVRRSSNNNTDYLYIQWKD